VLVLSNEARGAASWLDAAGVDRVSIPMHADTESLNVAAAAAVLVYEGRRDLLRASITNP
jgi:tRNA G18 (ribose-2'-O)-methylase SpoU